MPKVNRAPDVRYECGPACRSRQHVYDLNCAITKGNLLEIRTYFQTCHSDGSVKDNWGRTALHVAVSCGKPTVVQWLLSNTRADVRARDKESNWTALHRALFYRQLTCAEILLRAHSSLTVRDHEGLTPLDLLRRDSLSYMTLTRNDPNDLYTWGDNSNCTLGHAVDKGRQVPEIVDCFRNVDIKQISINKYHSVFLTTKGRVFTCGNGLGGRLGHDDEQTYLVAKPVKVGGSEVVCQIATSVDHTLLLTERGTIYSFGMNKHHQLGHLMSNKQFLSPRKINDQTWGKDRVICIATSLYHTAVCTDSALFTFGLNAGQLGHIKGDKYVINARQVSAIDYENDPPLCVEVSDYATIVQSKSGSIFLLQDYGCRKLMKLVSV